jgi:hypothetical protein
MSQSELEALQKRLESLLKETRQLLEKPKCVVCEDRVRTHLFPNCGHLCLCEKCAEKFTQCPVCKKEAKPIRVYQP